MRLLSVLVFKNESLENFKGIPAWYRMQLAMLCSISSFQEHRLASSRCKSSSFIVWHHIWGCPTAMTSFNSRRLYWNLELLASKAVLFRSRTCTAGCVNSEWPLNVHSNLLNLKFTFVFRLLVSHHWLSCSRCQVNISFWPLYKGSVECIHDSCSNIYEVSSVYRTFIDHNPVSTTDVTLDLLVLVTLTAI